MTEPSQPGDRCPYPRPFSWHFSECPAFMPRLHLPTDVRGKQLHAAWTCIHTVSRRHDEGGYYPGCALGDAAARRAWAGSLRQERLPAIRLARVELSEYIRPQLEKLREAFARPPDLRDSPGRAAARAALAGLAEAFDRFVREHPDLFLAAGIDGELLRQCFTEATAEFASRPPGRRWEMEEAIVTRYPWEIIAFFRPDLTRETSA